MRRLALAMLTAAFALTGCGIKAPVTGAKAPSGAVRARGAVGVAPATPWTIFVYGAGDNNLAESLLADINEMEYGLRADQVRFVVLADLAEKGDSRLLEVRPDAEGSNRLTSATIEDGGEVLGVEREVNTGDPATLERFVRWGTRHYPSENTMLVLWDHGSPAMPGWGEGGFKTLCSDDTSDDELSLPELTAAVRRLRDVQRLDLVGMDMCLAAHVETAADLAPLADYLVATEKIDPGDGWDYLSLAWRLSHEPALAPRAVAQAIVADYQNWHRKYTNKAVQVSAVDLRAVQAKVVPALEGLATAMAARLADRDGYWYVRTSLERAHQLSSAPDPQERSAIDLGLAANLLATCGDQALEAPAKALLPAYDEAVFANANVRTAADVYTGMKIYFEPLGYKAPYGDPRQTTFAGSAWNRFLQAFHAK